MPKFTRTIEDFVCGHCGAEVKGSGYTNHCPECLWSKHVDVNPGDRAEKCGGMMEPVRLELEKGQYHITHQCKKCKKTVRCKSSPQDNIKALTALSESLVKKALF